MSTDLTVLLERLDRLELAEAARSLGTRYARACDTIDLEGLGALFAPDAVLDIPSASYAGREAIVGFYRTALTPGLTRRHYMTNHDFEHVSPGVVRMTTYFLYTFAGDATSILGWGWYDDTVALHDGVALFTRKAIEVTHASDVREGWAT